MEEVALHKDLLLRWYKQEAVQQSILANAEGKEVAVKFGQGGFGKRPDLLKYPQDILSFVEQGATSFHISEEHWNNILHITPEMRRTELDQSRKGWDLVIDVDSKYLEYSKIASYLLVQAIKYHGVTDYSIKFSGNHGFHIGVGFSAFPETVNGIATKTMFPEGPRRIAFYLKDFIRDALAREILSKESIDLVMSKTGKPFTELVVQGTFDPYSVVGIDTILISSRHLYRSIYSFNEKSGLVSIPITEDQILTFEKAMADPAKSKARFHSFVPSTSTHQEAKTLIMQAFDYVPKEEKPKEQEIKEVQLLENAIPETLFPPCIKLLLQGVDDGRKRTLFILVNFFTSCGWSYDMIEKRLKEWNQKNKEPLKEVLLHGQLRYHKQQQKRILPPNCQNVMYYTDLRVCNPDNFCSRIRNPASYALRKNLAMQQEGKKKKKSRQQE